MHLFKFRQVSLGELIKTKASRTQDANSHEGSERALVESQRPLLRDNLGQAVDDAIIDLGVLGLGLETHFDDFKGLHDKDLGPSWIRGGVPATRPLK